ncbi:MAG TPA: SAM-dependent methyltransferase [Lichenihabitans sp.]|jgi:cyclopropane fatty-acyl-phospholipid synthase-like methyltransferase|nr:SAM-dependent methyltransferase [Lichenihabitans sp.]
MRGETLPIDHFARIYAARPDPWSYATSPYEQAKYAATLAALPRPRYARAFEVGCAEGVFTAMLAGRCATLLAAEPVARARAEARRRNADKSWVSVASHFVPRDWPEGNFDLVVVSEVIDYLGEADVEALSRKVCASLVGGGDVLLVHWVGKKTGPSSGCEASDRFIAVASGHLDVLHASRNGDYRMDVLRRL